MIESDHPILLAQFMVSNSIDRPPGISQANWDGDPLMLIISPVDQTRENVAFVAYDSPNIKSKYYVNVVTKIESSSYISLDGSPIIFQTLPNTGLSYAQCHYQRKHNMNSSCGQWFIAYVYGYGGVESYGYGVGFNLSIKLDLG